MKPFNFNRIFYRTSKSSKEHLELLFFDSPKPKELLVFESFNFFLVNAPKELNLLSFHELDFSNRITNEQNLQLQIYHIKEGESLQKIFYILLNTLDIIRITHFFDKQTHDDHQALTIIPLSAKSNILNPLNISLYDKEHSDFENATESEILDLRYSL